MLLTLKILACARKLRMNKWLLLLTLADDVTIINWNCRCLCGSTVHYQSSWPTIGKTVELWLRMHNMFYMQANRPQKMHLQHWLSSKWGAILWQIIYTTSHSWSTQKIGASPTVSCPRCPECPVSTSVLVDPCHSSQEPRPLSMLFPNHSYAYTAKVFLFAYDTIYEPVIFHALILKSAFSPSCPIVFI